MLPASSVGLARSRRLTHRVDCDVREPVRPSKAMVIDRRRGAAADAFVSVRLTHKYADAIDGVDVSRVNIGDHLRLPLREATLLIAEGWAVQSGAGINPERRQLSTAPHRSAEDRSVPCDQQGQLGPATTSPGHPLASTSASCECGHAGTPQRSIQPPSEPTKV
jgi:hypothetical protein